MKTYKNQTIDNAKQNDFQANFAFASDEIMSPTGIDVTMCENNGIKTYEKTTYNKEINTATIEVYSEKEWDKLTKINQK